VDDYPVTLFLSRDGYFKKITAQSLRMSGEQKYKEGDELKVSFESSNAHELLVVTDRQQIYKVRLNDLEDSKASSLGLYLPTKLGMDEGENVLTIIDPGNYRKDVLYVFENGKAARVALSAYETKTNRKKLVGAYSDKSPLRSILVLDEEKDIACFADDGRCIVFHSSLLQQKTSRATQRVGVLTLKAKKTLLRAVPLSETTIQTVSRYRVRNLPAAGVLLKPEDRGEEQLSLI